MLLVQYINESYLTYLIGCDAVSDMCPNNGPSPQYLRDGTKLNPCGQVQDISHAMNTQICLCHCSDTCCGSFYFNYKNQTCITHIGYEPQWILHYRDGWTFHNSQQGMVKKFKQNQTIPLQLIIGEFL